MVKEKIQYISLDNFVIVWPDLRSPIGFQHLYLGFADAYDFGVQIGSQADNIAGLVLLGNDTIYPTANGFSHRNVEKTVIAEGLAGAYADRGLEIEEIAYINLNPPYQSETQPTLWMDIMFDNEYLTAWSSGTTDCFFTIPLEDLHLLSLGES